MNETLRTPEGEAMWEKAGSIAKFLKDNLNEAKMASIVEKFQPQFPVDEIDVAETISLAQDHENYIAMSQAKRNLIDDIAKSMGLEVKD